MKKYGNILLNLAFFMLGLLLLYLAFYHQDLRLIWVEIWKVDFRWFVVVLTVSFLNQMIRAARWAMLLRPIKIKESFWALFWALMFGYMVNLAVPRLGEISRCLVLSRHKHPSPFATLLGTVFTERVLDVISLFLVILTAFWIHFELLYRFAEEYLLIPFFRIFLKEQGLIYGLILLTLGIGGLLWMNLKRLQRLIFFDRFQDFLRKLLVGIQSVFQLPQWGLFLWYTFLIWFTYFLMTYLWFFSLPATAHLGPSAGLALLAIGGVARLAPTQGGGIGAYQILVTRGLTLLGLAEIHGAVLAIVIHITQILFTLVFGGFAPIYFYFFRKKADEKDLVFP